MDNTIRLYNNRFIYKIKKSVHTILLEMYKYAQDKI